VFATRPGEPCALPPAKSERFVEMSEVIAPTWRNEVTVRSIEHMMRFEPAGWAPLVSPTPLMMVVGTADNVTFPQVQLEVFETVREPKRLVLHPGGHFQTYTDFFAQTSEPAAAWFTEHLRAG
jgi:fermentation-respiration switch protein FrsA (DUF1100 family)